MWTEAEKLRPRALLIEAVEFRHRFGDEVMKWRDAHIVPRYGSAGVRKFAFVMPAGFPDAGQERQEGPAIFPTKWFVNRQQAFGWLQTEVSASLRGRRERRRAAWLGQAVNRGGKDEAFLRSDHTVDLLAATV